MNYNYDDGIFLNLTEYNGNGRMAQVVNGISSFAAMFQSHLFIFPSDVAVASGESGRHAIPASQNGKSLASITVT